MLFYRTNGCCCSCIESEDALTFYRTEEERLASEQLKEKKKALMSPVGIAFITFEHLWNARKIYNDHKWKCCTKYPPAFTLTIYHHSVELFVPDV